MGASDDIDSRSDTEGDADHAIPSLAAYRWLALEPDDLLRQCRQARFQGSGPGGQKRNRVYSGVRVSHPESGLTAESVDSRASLRNLHSALGRLRMSLALSASFLDRDPALCAAEVPQPAFRAGANPGHADYPRFLLMALHRLAWHHGQLAPAAEALDCTASALTRFFKSDKGAWAKARGIRSANGLHPLK
ncbi:MAG: prfA 2 [Fibrobacteres bacterium]|nr:prfA 2 [Fibrobacterota bacterium]